MIRFKNALDEFPTQRAKPLLHGVVRINTKLGFDFNGHQGYCSAIKAACLALGHNSAFQPIQQSVGPFTPRAFKKPRHR